MTEVYIKITQFFEAGKRGKYYFFDYHYNCGIWGRRLELGVRYGYGNRKNSLEEVAKDILKFLYDNGFGINPKFNIEFFKYFWGGRKRNTEKPAKEKASQLLKLLKDKRIIKESRKEIKEKSQELIGKFNF